MKALVLPSLADVIVVIVILIPGFLSLQLFRIIAVYERKISYDQIVLWSLVCSLFIYGIFSYFTGISNLDDIRDKIFEPNYLFLILFLGAVVGFYPGIITKLLFRRNIVTGDCWEASMKEASKRGSWVIVYTNDGDEFMGTLHYSGSGEEPREISIRDPSKIIRLENGETSEFEFGMEIFFPDRDIKRIVFFEEV